MVQILFIAGLVFASFWIAEMVRGVAYDRGRQVHLVVAIGCTLFAPLLWLGGSGLAAAADADARALIAIAVMALAFAIGLLAVIEWVRWFGKNEIDGA
ncbi:MAG TPA: hypothetical protein VF552_13930 [Allosphingosinicella sp.]|jgi:hypothetical protein